MSQVIALMVIVGTVAAALALWSRAPLTWIREEIELMRRDTWEPQQLPAGPSLTLADPQCRRMVIRQRSRGVYLRHAGVRPKVAISSAVAHHPNTHRFARVAR